MILMRPDDISVGERVKFTHLPGWHYVRAVNTANETVTFITEDGEREVEFFWCIEHREVGVDPHLLPKWTPFRRAQIPPVTEAQIAAAVQALPDVPREAIEAQFRDVENDTVFLNSRYQVNVRYLDKSGVQANGQDVDMAHLSIKKLDKTAVGAERYRDFMRIRDDLIGREREAVEIYPGRNREVDTANQYHLWVFGPKVRLPFGFTGTRNVTDITTDGTGHVQAVFEDHHPK